MKVRDLDGLQLARAVVELESHITPGEPVVLLRDMKEDDPHGGDFPPSVIPAGTLMSLVYRKSAYSAQTDNPGQIWYITEAQTQVKARRLGITTAQLLDDELFYLPCADLGERGKTAYLNFLLRPQRESLDAFRADGSEDGALDGRVRAMREWPMLTGETARRFVRRFDVQHCYPTEDPDRVAIPTIYSAMSPGDARVAMYGAEQLLRQIRWDMANTGRILRLVEFDGKSKRTVEEIDVWKA